ncbi:hypothetical protein N0V90_004392 [Kalmusia sp. IMI 367209]|nr:hypothetical protein N0V90_004392 [Kalmusia sp. IMI 367209]
MGPKQAVRATTQDRPLRQVQYRSFMTSIMIYHYPHTRVPVRAFEGRLLHKMDGFVSRLESSDTLVTKEGMSKHPIPEDDEIPEGSTEVAYLPNVFRDKGCALGFRFAGRYKIEWMCFKKPIDDLLATTTIDEDLLFDPVAELPRGPQGRDLKGTVKGHLEHRLWYDGLLKAEKPSMSLRITWKNRLQDLRNQRAEVDGREEASGKEMHGPTARN